MGRLHALVKQGLAEQALTNILLRNSTGIGKEWDPDKRLTAEIKFIRSLTLGDVLGPFDFIDSVEADLQQSEIAVFAPTWTC